MRIGSLALPGADFTILRAGTKHSQSAATVEWLNRLDLPAPFRQFDLNEGSGRGTNGTQLFDQAAEILGCCVKTCLNACGQASLH